MKNKVKEECNQIVQKDLHTSSQFHSCRYQTKLDFVSKSFRDQQTSPLERAIWWTEYVIRNKGAPQLRSPAADLSWIEYLMLDVIIAVHFALFVGYWLLKKTLKAILSLCSAKSDGPKRKKKREQNELKLVECIQFFFFFADYNKSILCDHFLILLDSM